MKTKQHIIFFVALLCILLNKTIHAQPGSIDFSFNTSDIGLSNGDGISVTSLHRVYSSCIQSDGKIMVVGLFSTYNGTSTHSIARLKTNGTLDSSFNEGTGPNLSIRTIALQSDGKIIIGGEFTSYNGTSRNRIARLNSDGSLDTGFNPGTGANLIVSAISVQSDGKVIIGGDFTSYNGTAINRIARLNANGTIDATFNPGLGVNANVYSTAIQSDGKIIIGGAFTSYNGTAIGRIARVNTNGTIDATFNSSGVGANGYINSTSIQSNGKIIIGGWFTSYNGTTRNRIARLNANGTLDGTFNPGTGANSYIYATSIQSDGKIIIGGWFTSYSGTSRNRIARLNSNGSLDATFNPGLGANDNVYTTPIQSDGKIIIGGSFTSYNGTTRNRVARLNINGTNDLTFNTGTGANGNVYSTAIQSDGKIIIGGDFTLFNGASLNRIARLNTNGTLDLTFTPDTGANNTISAIAIQSDGKIIIGGAFTSYNGNPISGIARLNNNGTLDSGFNPSANGGSGKTISIQSDGKIIIGGLSVKRLNTDGTIDATFNQGFGPNAIVNSTSIQSDGKILIGGFFTSYNGTAINRIARINTNGTLDTTFNLGAGTNGAVGSTYIQSDGKIIIGGGFTFYNGTYSNAIARLNADGTLDATFNGASGGSPLSIQSDGKIIIGGRKRLNTDGTLDATFNSGTGASGTVYSTAIQSDGKIIIGGNFTSYSGIGRNRVLRINGGATGAITGIETTVENRNVNVYPNPFSNKLNIEIEGSNEKQKLEILNAIGQVVFNENFVEKTTIQTSNFAPGVYIIKLENGKTIEFKKIIKE